ncbi:MAG: hypothetical protein ACI9GW_003218, partial [Halieaceae bacterium]
LRPGPASAGLKSPEETIRSCAPRRELRNGPYCAQAARIARPRILGSLLWSSYSDSVKAGLMTMQIRRCHHRSAATQAKSMAAHVMNMSVFIFFRRTLSVRIRRGWRRYLRRCLLGKNIHQTYLLITSWPGRRLPSASTQCSVPGLPTGPYSGR